MIIEGKLAQDDMKLGAKGTWAINRALVKVTNFEAAV
jgi:hypothetical protein